jgi:hypothetical protein
MKIICDKEGHDVLGKLIDNAVKTGMFADAKTLDVVRAGISLEEEPVEEPK